MYPVAVLGKITYLNGNNFNGWKMILLLNYMRDCLYNMIRRCIE